MLTVEEVESIDSLGLYKYFEDWPNHCQKALNLQIKHTINFNPSRIIYSGLGGSAAPGDILKNWLSSILKIPFIVLKDYDLPEYVGRQDLVLAVSCSGDTEEVLQVTKNALNRGCNILTISSGGMLEDFSIKNSIPFTKITRLKVSRASFPYLFYVSENILKKLELIKDVEKQLYSSTLSIKEIQKEISVHTPINKNPAKKLASKIYDGIPIIYVSAENRKIATRFKASLNENAKMFAHSAIIPELCHNEVEIWNNKATKLLKPLFIRHSNESTIITNRFKVMKEIIEDAGFEVIEFWETGKDYLSRLLRSLYLLDYTSIYTAILNNENPLETIRIDSVKRKMLKL